LREGLFELEKATTHTLPKLIELADLKGILHNHSTYSDGLNTLEEMAVYAKQLGYEYLGMCDHSKSASYAGGLKVEDIILQHNDIDKLNKQLFPFKIFKGIESDILGNGDLDYEEDVLKSFDFIVASIHSNLKMDEEKATQRLLKAIENPYTTILGHPTGRLLLGRPGYPIDHKKIIDACAANNVVIELNAHPYRLDIDWRWIPYCLEKGVMISINPDAHQLKGYHDMYYGTLAARKGLLTKDNCLNAMNLNTFENYLETKK
jgi:DNA polymerase (family 10)